MFLGRVNIFLTLRAGRQLNIKLTKGNSLRNFPFNFVDVFKFGVIEIDFIISNNSKLKYQLYPIEVKSGKKYTTTSLNRFMEKYKSRIGESYIIHPKNLDMKNDIVCIPAYMTFCL